MASESYEWCGQTRTSTAITISPKAAEPSSVMTLCVAVIGTSLSRGLVGSHPGTSAWWTQHGSHVKEQDPPWQDNCPSAVSGGAGAVATAQPDDRGDPRATFCSRLGDTVSRLTLPSGQRTGLTWLVSHGGCAWGYGPPTGSRRVGRSPIAQPSGPSGRTGNQVPSPVWSPPALWSGRRWPLT
jgi:hypothetical protein